MKRFLPLLLFLVLSPETAALACSIAPPPPMTHEERAAEAEKHRQAFLDWGRNAEAIVRIRALSTSGYGESTALVKVLKTLHGKMRRGTILRLKTVDTGLCGRGDLKRGQHGIVIIDKKKPLYFNGFLQEADLAEFRKEGILPPEG